jgi:hypothetical protein
MPFTPITVTGHWEGADGSPMVGTVTVRLDRQITNDGVIASAVSTILELDSNGDLVGEPTSEAANPDAIQVTGNTTAGQEAVTNVSSVAGLEVGAGVSDAGGVIPPGATIASVGVASITLSDPANATAAGVALTVAPVAPSPVPAIFYANNDPGTTPTGSTYHWVLQIGAVPSPQMVGAPSPPVEFDAILDHNAPGGTVDVGSLLPAEDDT